MKSKILCSLLIMLSLNCSITFAQSDTIFRHHLLVKFAPFTYLGTHSALQFGLEANLTAKTTLGFDYAFGDAKISPYRANSSYVEGETSKRYRLEFKWYKRHFAENAIPQNTFVGIEIFNRTNFYPNTITVGRYCANGVSSFNSNSCNYYERVATESSYSVWGVFFKFGKIKQIDKNLWVEWYGGLGITSRVNTVGSYALGPYDYILGNTSSSGSTLKYFDFHNTSNINFIAPDALLSLKFDYQLF